MTVGVSHTFGGNVVVVDMDTGRRWDMTPEMAATGAKQCLTAARYMTSSVLIAIKALDDRSFRFAGSRDDTLKMAADLFENAKAARKRSRENPVSGGYAPQAVTTPNPSNSGADNPKMLAAVTTPDDDGPEAA